MPIHVLLMVDGLGLKASAADIENWFAVGVPASYASNPAINPGDRVLVMTAATPGEATLLPWGVQTSDRSNGYRTTVPADRIDDDPTLTRAFETSRVLVLAEELHIDRGSLVTTGTSPFAIAGIHLTGADGDGTGGVVLITVPGGDGGPDTLPVVVPPGKVEIWLHYSHATQLSALLEAPPASGYEWEPATE